MAKSRGIDALINDSLIGSVLGMGTLFIGIVTAGSPLLYVKFSAEYVNPSALTYGLIALGGFFIGIVEFSVLANVIDSGVVVTFVCLAEDPMALAATKPLLFGKIQQVYPQVTMGV